MVGRVLVAAAWPGLLDWARLTQRFWSLRGTYYWVHSAAAGDWCRAQRQGALSALLLSACCCCFATHGLQYVLLHAKREALAGRLASAFRALDKVRGLLRGEGFVCW